MPPLVLFQMQRFLSSEKTASPSGEQLTHVAPVHAHEGDCAVAAGRGGMSEKPVISTSNSRSIGLQFDREQLAVPAGVQGKLVVGDDIGPALSRIEVGQAKRRNALHPEMLGSFDAAVPGDDLVIITDQDWVGEAELSDAVGICRICFLEWVRAFPVYGRRRATPIDTTEMGF